MSLFKTKEPLKNPFNSLRHPEVLYAPNGKFWPLSFPPSKKLNAHELFYILTFNKLQNPQQGQEIFLFSKMFQSNSRACPPTLMFHVYQGLILQRKSSWGAWPTTHLHLMLRLRISGDNFSSAIRFYSMVHN